MTIRSQKVSKEAIQRRLTALWLLNRAHCANGAVYRLTSPTDHRDAVRVHHSYLASSDAALECSELALCERCLMLDDGTVWCMMLSFGIPATNRCMISRTITVQIPCYCLVCYDGSISPRVWLVDRMRMRFITTAMGLDKQSSAPIRAIGLRSYFK